MIPELVVKLTHPEWKGAPIEVDVRMLPGEHAKEGQEMLSISGPIPGDDAATAGHDPVAVDVWFRATPPRLVVEVWGPLANQKVTHELPLWIEPPTPT